MRNVCVTGVAADHIVLPVWLAVIEQVPGATSVTVTPRTVQNSGLLEVNVTVRPEVAVALSGGTDCPIVTLLSGPNVIVCGSATTVEPNSTVTVPSPELVTARSSMPSPLKSATAMDCGAFPTINGEPVIGANPPETLPNSTVTLLLP